MPSSQDRPKKEDSELQGGILLDAAKEFYIRRFPHKRDEEEAEVTPSEGLDQILTNISHKEKAEAKTGE